MAGYKNIKKIDGEKLKEILYEKGRTLADYSVDCGFGESFFSNSIRRNQLNNIGIKYLESIGIPFEEYAVKEVVEKPIEVDYIPQDEKLVMNMTCKELEEAMYRAFYSALKHADLKATIQSWHVGRKGQE